MTKEWEERIRILRELEGVKCFCGKKKNSMMSFCYRDYKSLPPRIQDALYRRSGDGYEEAYAKARQWLRERDDPARAES